MADSSTRIGIRVTELEDGGLFVEVAPDSPQGVTFVMLKPAEGWVLPPPLPWRPPADG